MQAIGKTPWAIAVWDGRILSVCERIVDADERTFTDTCAWYRAAALGGLRGPWLATTRASAL
jgi:hypothetical protein